MKKIIGAILGAGGLVGVIAIIIYSAFIIDPLVGIAVLCFMMFVVGKVILEMP